jgi:hypothetical protein
MGIKVSEIKLSEIAARLGKIEERVCELAGEKMTLVHKLDNNAIHPMLFMLKLDALDFEAMLLQEETAQIEFEYNITKLLTNSGIELSR